MYFYLGHFLTLLFTITFIYEFSVALKKYLNPPTGTRIKIEVTQANIIVTFYSHVTIYFLDKRQLCFAFNNILSYS